MNCREVHHLFVVYLDHEVIPSEQTMIEAHLAGCASCERDLSALRSTRSRLAEALKTQAAAAAPSPQAFARLQARLAEEARTPPSRFSAWRVRSKSDPGRTTPYYRGAVTMRMRWKIAVGIATIAAIGAITVASVPAARASATDFFSGLFGGGTVTGSMKTTNGTGSFSIMGENSGIQLSYVPEALVGSTGAGLMVVGGGPGEQENKSDLLFLKDGAFLSIKASAVTPGEALPEGESVTINGQAAVLNTGLSGQVLMAPAPSEASGEMHTQTAGGQSPPTFTPLTYKDANKLTWDIGDVRIEMLSNVSAEELQKVANGLKLGK